MKQSTQRTIAAFLKADKYVDYDTPLLQEQMRQLFSDRMTEEEKCRAAFYFVRDEIPHSFDVNKNRVTARASQVLRYRTGICHAKANLLAALLRGQGIPTGFCFSHITVAADASQGYCLHGYTAILLGGRWIKVDARGNTNGIRAQFSLQAPVLAFPVRPEQGEYEFPGVYSVPDRAAMELLERACTLEEVRAGLPDTLSIFPDIAEQQTGTGSVYG